MRARPDPDPGVRVVTPGGPEPTADGEGITIGLVTAPPPSGVDGFGEDCDVVIAEDVAWYPGAVAGDEEDVAVLVTRVEGQVHAAAVLCQLLRRPAVDVEAGLLAESLAYAVLQGSEPAAAWRARNRAGRPADDLDQPRVSLSRNGDEVEIRMQRPDSRNALDTRMRDELVEAFELVRVDDRIDRVSLTGAGPVFCSGGDLREFGSFPDPLVAHFVRSVRLPARALALVADRVTAHLHGPCAGAGVELAAFAAEVVAAPDTTVRLPEVGMGLVPGSGGTVSIPRRIGRHRTAWLALSGAAVGATTALDWGLVDRLSTS